MFSIVILLALPPSILAQLGVVGSSISDSVRTPAHVPATPYVVRPTPVIPSWPSALPSGASGAPGFASDSAPTSATQPIDKDTGVKYYFVFVVVLLLLVVIGFWIGIHRRDKHKAQSRMSRQSALAQDLDGWPNTRRWLHGNWRSERNRDGSNVARREEGLNEHGQAPPPYQPASNSQQLHGSDGIAVPSPAFTAPDSGPKPPEY